MCVLSRQQVLNRVLQEPSISRRTSDLSIPERLMMTGFSAQLLNARQCVGLNMLKETAESQKQRITLSPPTCIFMSETVYLCVVRGCFCLPRHFTQAPL